VAKHRNRLPRGAAEWRYSKPSGNGPEQPALVDPALSRRLDQKISRGAFQPWPCFNSTTEPNPNASECVNILFREMVWILFL